MSVTTESPTTALHTCLGFIRRMFARRLESTRTVSTLLRVRLRAMIATYVAIAGLLQKFSSDPEGEKAELLRQLVANLALGNWDAHAKNTSFLYCEQMVPTLAPLYDVVPIAEVEPRTTLLSMRVNGVIDTEKLTRADVVAEAVSWGLATTDVGSVVDRVLKNLEEGIRIASTAYPAAAARHEANALERIRKLKGDIRS